MISPVKAIIAHAQTAFLEMQNAAMAQAMDAGFMCLTWTSSPSLRLGSELWGRHQSSDRDQRIGVVEASFGDSTVEFRWKPDHRPTAVDPEAAVVEAAQAKALSTGPARINLDSHLPPDGPVWSVSGWLLRPTHSNVEVYVPHALVEALVDLHRHDEMHRADRLGAAAQRTKPLRGSTMENHLRAKMDAYPSDEDLLAGDA